MKNIKNILIISLLLLFIVPFSLAIENSNITDKDIDELNIISTKIGAEVRLTQLELSLENQINKAEDILSELRLENVTNESLINLTNSISKLELLLDDVKSMDLNQTSVELAVSFVAIKKEAITISQEFKKQTISIINENKRFEIRQKIEQNNKQKIEEKKQLLAEKKQEFYLESLSKLLFKSGLLNETIQTKLELGNLTREQVKEMIGQIYSNISSENKQNLRENVQKQKDEINLLKETKKEEIKERYELKKTEIFDKIQNRLNNLNTQRNETRNKITEKIKFNETRFEERQPNNTKPELPRIKEAINKNISNNRKEVKE